MSLYAASLFAPQFWVPELFKDLVVTATVVPTVDGYQVLCTPPMDLTLYAVVLRSGAPPPNGAQVAIGSDGSGVPGIAKKEVFASSLLEAQLTFSGLELPEYDVYVAYQEVFGDHAVCLEDANVNKLPAAGRHYIDVAIA